MAPTPKTSLSAGSTPKSGKWFSSQGAENKVVAFDYAGIQARNVAMESRDRNLTKAFWDRYDIHSDWAEELARAYPRWVEEGVKVMARDKKVFKIYRDKAKNKFVFPSFFGAQPPSIAGNLRIPVKKIEHVREIFFDRFGGVSEWHEQVHLDYRKYGYITSLSGLRRRAPVPRNQAINAPIQADEVCIVLDAMNRLSEYGQYDLQPNMEIHDDLTFIWPKKKVEKLAEIVIKEMIAIKFDWINVPLQVEMSIGDNWADLEEVGKYSSDDWNGKVFNHA